MNYWLPVILIVSAIARGGGRGREEKKKKGGRKSRRGRVYASPSHAAGKDFFYELLSVIADCKRKNEG